MDNKILEQIRFHINLLKENVASLSIILQLFSVGLLITLRCFLFSKSWCIFSCEWCCLPYLQIVLNILPREAVSEHPKLIIDLADELTNIENFHSALKYYLLAINDTLNVSIRQLYTRLFLFLQLLLRHFGN